MGGVEQLEPLFVVPFDVDEQGLESLRDSEAIVGDTLIPVLLRQNRLALSKGKTLLVPTPPGADPGLAYYDATLSCVVHAHPECQFRWARLVVDLSSTPGARIRDMVPREVRGDRPVELKTTISLGLKFETIAKVIGGEVRPEVSTSRTAYFPEIISSGVNLASGYWDFLSGASEHLHADRELRLLISAPTGALLSARFRLNAKVALRGLPGLIPIFVRTGGIDEAYRLI